MIVIDEPNSFLHPSAVRRLIGVLKSYRSHQFVISTHSPEVINCAIPEAVFLVRWEQDHSEIECLGRAGIQATRQILDEIGARLSDVFSSDAIIWVEGPTEESAFPLLLESLYPGRARAVAFVPVSTPGDFGGRQRRLALDVHQRLAAGNALIPPTLAFIFDRETRTQQELDDLSRSLSGKVKFLPRRTYENFLLHAGALAALLTDIVARVDGSRPTITTDGVQTWLDANGEEPDLFVSTAPPPAVRSVEWLRLVNAPLLLNRLFEKMTNTCEIYRKVTHSRCLTEWLLTNDPEFLADLTGFMRGLMQDIGVLSELGSARVLSARREH